MRESNKSEMPSRWFDRQKLRYHLIHDLKTNGHCGPDSPLDLCEGRDSAVDTGIDHGTMSRFMNRKGMLTTDQLDPLAELLDWTIVIETKPPARRRRKVSEGK